MTHNPDGSKAIEVGMKGRPEVLPFPEDGLCQEGCGRFAYFYGVKLTGMERATCELCFVARAKRNASRPLGGGLR